MSRLLVSGQTFGRGLVSTKVGAVRARGHGDRLPVVRVLQREPREGRRERERGRPNQQTETADRQSHSGGVGVVQGRQRRPAETRLPGDRGLRRFDGGPGPDSPQSPADADPRFVGQRRERTFLPRW